MTSSLAAVGELAAEFAELRLSVRRHLADELDRGAFTPAADAWLSGVDPAFSRRLAARGWVGMTIPRQYGGAGRSNLQRFVVIEELLAAGAPVAAHWVAERQMAPGILRHGTEGQRQTYLPGIARAERIFAIGMSEPDAGSDLGSVRSRARVDPRGWRLSGTKLWTSSAHVATNLVALVRTDDGENPHGGLSQFIIDLPHPNIHISPITTIDGGNHFNEVVFDDALLPATALLGTRGNGWRQVTQELADERSGPERILSTFPLLQAWAQTPASCTSPAGRLAVGALVCRIVVLRHLSLAVAAKLAAGGNPAVEAAMVKDLGTVFEGELVEVVRRLAGIEPDPQGVGLAALLARAVLRTPGFTLRGGTNEMLRSIVAKGLAA